MTRLEFTAKEGYCFVRCTAYLGALEAQELSENIQANLKQNYLYILEMAGVLEIDPGFYRPLVLGYQNLKKAGGFLCSVNLGRDVATQIHAAGLDSVFSPKNDLAEALATIGVKTAKVSIDVGFVNPFIAATKSTLESQCSTRVNVGKPYLKNSDQELAGIDIAGVISLTSNAFTGSIAICFPAVVFLNIYASMLGQPVEKEITRDSEDAAAEILNIIFGQAKAELNDKQAYQIQRAIPSIIRGQQLKVHHFSRNVAVIMPFTTDFGPFHLEISTEVL